jgi:hypothetical protein
MKPVSASYVKVAEVPAILIHNKALKDSKVPIRSPNVITQHVRGAAQMEDLGGIYRVTSVRLQVEQIQLVANIA